MPSPASSPMAGSSTPASRAGPTCSTTPEAPFLLPPPLLPPPPRARGPPGHEPLPCPGCCTALPSLPRRDAAPLPWRGAEDLFETTTEPRNNGGAPESRPRQRWSAGTTVRTAQQFRRCTVVSAEASALRRRLGTAPRSRMPLRDRLWLGGHNHSHPGPRRRGPPTQRGLAPGCDH